MNYEEWLKWLLISWPITSWILHGLDNLKLPMWTDIFKCQKCLSFFITLVFTGDFFTASAVSLMMMFIEKIQNKKTML